MKNIISAFLICLVFTFTNSLTYAQEVTPLAGGASANMRWFCLKPMDASPGTHTTGLAVGSGVGYESTKPVNVVVRIAWNQEVNTALEMTGDNSSMTTANMNLDDKILGGHTGYTTLVDLLGFSGVGLKGGNPALLTKEGVTPYVVWTDDLVVTQEDSTAIAHYWYGVQEAPVEANTDTGEGGGTQFGSFSFDSAGSAKDCEIIRWDPFGYIFDAVTHGPVAGASVRILSSATENGIYTPVQVGVGKGMVGQNPIFTQKDGSYRFYVEPGYYKLEVAKYTIENDLAQIKEGYEEFGYEQLYLAETPEVIHEMAGKVERRDIAIKTIGAPAPFSQGPKLKDILVSSTIKNGVQAVRLSGMVSQIPVDLIAVYKDLDNSIVDEVVFSLVRGHKYVPQKLHDERNFDIVVNSELGSGILKELKVMSKYSSKIVTVPISPMPSYLNGIALTKNGAPMISGTVEILPIGSDRPSYTTTTDENGKFEVSSDWIPPMPYELKYKSATGEIYTVSTTEYLKQNKSFHSKSKIDSFEIKTIGSDKAASKKNNNSMQSGRVQPTTQAPSSRGFASGNQGIVMIIAIIIMLVLIMFGAFVMMRSRQKKDQTVI